MKHCSYFRPGVLRAAGRCLGLIICGASVFLFVPGSRAQQPAVPVDSQALPGRLPDQAHVMMDVGYHFANLWFAADRQNWPLAGYYLEETRSHLKWAVRIQPVRTTKSGASVDLNGILDAVDNSLLAQVAKAIESKDAAAFKNAYRQSIEGCYACHAACEKPFLRVQVPDAPGGTIINFGAAEEAAAKNAPSDDASLGNVFFQQNCALCHSTTLGPGNTLQAKQGPSLVGVVGRRSASTPNFSYTKGMVAANLTWDATTLDKFLANPTAVAPGTTMPVPVPSAENRQHVIAYLKTLIPPAGFNPNAEQAPSSLPFTDAGDWTHDAPGVKHRIDLAALPAPYATAAAANNPQTVAKPEGKSLSVPPHFKVQLFASGLSGPRLLRVAPNGDIFIAETRERSLRVMRAADGAEAPAENEVFAEGLDRPFGFAFYPPGDNPQWLYVANNNAVVRFEYRNGDLKARGAPQVIVRKLASTTGGHTTRDVVFSKDGQRMFISVGSSGNAAEELKKKDEEALRLWNADHALGVSWDADLNRADILVTDPEGHTPFHPFATGVRNGAGLAVDPTTGELWTSTNERDGIGDDLVPDYITRVKEGGFYGWPWYYMGNHEDPRHAGERPDLAGKVTVPDVPLQPHSATLEITFYNITNGPAAFPAEYRGDIFAAFHGSWNRRLRTGSKVVRVRLNHGVPTGEYEDFMTGFIVDNKCVWGRPVGVTVAHDGALLVTDDANGTLWRVSYTGQ